MSDRYLVIGHPVSHSKSPQIHRMFASQTGEKLCYDRFDGDPEAFEQQLYDLFSRGLSGCNITVPFKARAHAACQSFHDDMTRDCGAVNTLWMTAAGLTGANTDGPGLVRDLFHNKDWGLSEKTCLRILLLGAGGASRGVLPFFRPGQCGAVQRFELVVANRTAEKARALARQLEGRQGVCVRGLGLEAIDQPFDLVVNATSASLGGSGLALPAVVWSASPCVYDMMYSQEDTAFMAQARALGMTRISDGLGMLIEQAAEAFLLWRGVRPDTAPVMQALRPGTGS
jgi:shikimate dehydrogenase